MLSDYLQSPLFPPREKQHWSFWLRRTTNSICRTLPAVAMRVSSPLEGKRCNSEKNGNPNKCIGFLLCVSFLPPTTPRSALAGSLFFIFMLVERVTNRLFPERLTTLVWKAHVPNVQKKTTGGSLRESSVGYRYWRGNFASLVPSSRRHSKAHTDQYEGLPVQKPIHGQGTHSAKLQKRHHYGSEIPLSIMTYAAPEENSFIQRVTFTT